MASWGVYGCLGVNSRTDKWHPFGGKKKKITTFTFGNLSLSWNMIDFWDFLGKTRLSDALNRWWIVQKYRYSKINPVSVFSSSRPLLTHYQMTNFRLFQTERVCRRQFQIWRKWQKVIQMGRKPIMSNFSFSHSVFKTLVSQGRQKASLYGNGLISKSLNCFTTMIFGRQLNIPHAMLKLP